MVLGCAEGGGVMLTQAQMLAFCHKDGSRFKLMKPFEALGFFMATDGRVLVAQRERPEGFEEVPGATPKVDGLLNHMLSATGGWRAVWERAVTVKEVRCRTCKGAGRCPVQEECGRCRGRAYETCDLGHEHTCRSCSGSGLVPSAEELGDCLTCEGRGSEEVHPPVQALGSIVCNSYLRLVTTLPGLEVHVPDSTPPRGEVIVLRWAGGLAALMPMIANDRQVSQPAGVRP